MRVKVTICHILNVLSQYLTNRNTLTRVCVVTGSNDSKESSLNSGLDSSDSNPFQTKLKARKFYIVFFFKLLLKITGASSGCSAGPSCPTISQSEITPKIMILSLTMPVSQFKYK